MQKASLYDSLSQWEIITTNHLFFLIILHNLIYDYYYYYYCDVPMWNICDLHIHIYNKRCSFVIKNVNKKVFYFYTIFARLFKDWFSPHQWTCSSILSFCLPLLQKWTLAKKKKILEKLLHASINFISHLYVKKENEFHIINGEQQRLNIKIPMLIWIRLH